MSQISFSDAEHAGRRKRTRREVFLAEMELVVPWRAQLKVIEPHYPVPGRGRQQIQQELAVFRRRFLHQLDHLRGLHRGQRQRRNAQRGALGDMANIGYAT